LIKFSNISKYYGKTTALDTVDLDIEGGLTTVLIGQSGCGKSTILRLITGLIKPDTGSVEVSGEKLGPENLKQTRWNMGYVIQEGGLFPHMTAEGNVSIMASYLGWSKEKIRTRIHELCDLTKFPVEALSRYPFQVSGGQSQRVSLMRALMLDPDILLLDEPLGALDPLIRSELQTDLKAIFSELKKTVLIVTHDVGEAGYFGDKIVFLRDGKVIQKGTINDLLERPADKFVTKFINAQRSPVNLTEGGG